MSKHLCGYRTHAAMAMDYIRSEGWRVRRLAVDVWQVRDRRPHRWEYQYHVRRFRFNHDGLLAFAGVYETDPLGRYPTYHVADEITDEDCPF